MAAIQFPPDLIYEILSRLPIKSLARFRCVCKSWLKYINNPYLHTTHRFKEEPTPIIFQLLPSANPNQGKLCKISFLRLTQGTTTSGEAWKKTPELKNFINEGVRGSNFRSKMGKLKLCVKIFGRKKTIGSPEPTPGTNYPSPPLTVKKDYALEVPYIGSLNGTLVLGSCNGLTLVCYEKSYLCGTFLAVINPLTKQRYNLPPVKLTKSSSWELQAAGIAFDDSTSTLTTVCVLRKESFWSPSINPQLCTVVHHSGMSSWREMPQNPPYPISCQSVFANGRLHWLARLPDIYEGIVLVWFDVKTEEFGLTDVPRPKSDFLNMCQLVDLHGEVGFAYNYGGICIKLWVLKLEEWVLWCWFDLDMLRYTDVAVSGCWNNDGDILLNSNRGKRLFVYTLKTDDLKEVELDGGCNADIRMHRSCFISIRGINTSA